MGFHAASFGIFVSDHYYGDLIRLLFKEILCYDLDGKLLGNVNPDDNICIDGRYSRLELVPYRDYMRKEDSCSDEYTPMPDRITVTCDDEFCDFLNETSYVWEDGIVLESAYGCRYVLGFGLAGSENGYKVAISPVQMENLEKLRQRLFAEHRISGIYALVGNCCS